MADQSYSERMIEFIDARIPEGEFIVAIFATELVKELAISDVALLKGWLQENAVKFMADRVNDLLMARRRNAHRDEPRQSFATAARRFEEDPDDVTRLRHFDATHAIDDKNTRRRVADMTGADHAFVAGAYHSRAQSNLMREAFHLAVAKKVGEKKTSDVMTDEEYGRLFRSIAKGGTTATGDQAA